jgi:hypothetical protein
MQRAARHADVDNLPRRLPEEPLTPACSRRVQIIAPLVNDWIHDSHKM